MTALDLTHALHNGMPVFPGLPGPSFDPIANVEEDGYWTGWSYPDAEASRALIERGISAVGFDGPSADPVDTTTYDLHRVWLGAGRLILQNVEQPRPASRARAARRRADEGRAREWRADAHLRPAPRIGPP